MSALSDGYAILAMLVIKKDMDDGLVTPERMGYMDEYLKERTITTKYSIADTLDVVDNMVQMTEQVIAESWGYA